MNYSHCSLNLANAFTVRIRQYLLVLEATSHTEIVCTITDFLPVQDILSLLSTSQHFFSLGQIQSIEIRLLKAKLQFYEKPRAQHSFSPFMMYMPLRMQSELPAKRTDILKNEHQALKKFNEEMRMFKEFKKMGLVGEKITFQKFKEQKGLSKLVKVPAKRSRSKNNNRATAEVRRQNSWKAVKANELKAIDSGRQLQNKIKVINNSSKPDTNPNPYIRRLRDLEYQLAKEDYEKRKMQRMLEAEQRAFISLEQLKQMGDLDPCSREVYQRVYEEEKARMQTQNRSRLRMKTLGAKKDPIHSEQMIEPQKVKKVVREPIVAKIIDKVGSLFMPARKPSSL